MSGQQAEQLVKITHAYNDQKLYYIADTTFANISISGSLKMQVARERNSYDKVAAILGEPALVKHSQDTAVDGTVLFRYKTVTAPGLEISYQDHNEFVMTSLELSTVDHFLNVGGFKIQVGMPRNEVEKILPEPSLIRKDDQIGIKVAGTNSKGEVIQKDENSVAIGFKTIIINFDPDTDRVSKVSVSVRYT